MGTHPHAHALDGTPQEEYREAITGDEPDASAHPIEVRVVEPIHVQEFPARTLTANSVTIPLADVRPRLLIPEQRLRTRLVLRNSVGTPITVSGTDQIGPGGLGGYLLAVGQSVTIFASCAIYVCSDGVQATVISWYGEHRDG